MSSKDNFQRIQNVCRQGGGVSGQLAGVLIEVLNRLEKLELDAQQAAVQAAMEER
jgi:hypothetical protein